MKKKRLNCVTTKTIPEVEEMEFFNNKTRENRDKHIAEQVLNNYRRLFAAVCRHVQEEADAAQAEEQRLRQRKRIYQRQMRKLTQRVLLCVATIIGVCLSWWFDLVAAEFLLGVVFLCSCIIAFSFGTGREKGRQFGGEKR